MSKLPDEKRYKLTDKFADDVHRFVREKQDDLVKHDVDKKTARRIVDDALDLGKVRKRWQDGQEDKKEK